jgi:Lamin Tail Domain
MKKLHAALVAGALVAVAHSASAAVIVSEVDPFGSNGNDGYSADWFELTNTGTSAVSIAGWTMVDNHAATNSTTPYVAGATISIGNVSKSKPAAALTLANGSTTLAAGQSAIFLEDSGLSASDTTALISSFETAWFGTKTPAGLLVGTYNDSSSGNFGLSQDPGDMVNVFNGSSSSATLEASVAFGVDSGSPIGTFQNDTGLNDTTLTTQSVAGVDGAFVSASNLEVGSPGTVSAVPLPDSVVLLLSGLGAFGLFAFSPRAQGRRFAR